MVCITRWLTPEPFFYPLRDTRRPPLLKFLRNGGIICNKALSVLSLTPHHAFNERMFDAFS